MIVSFALIVMLWDISPRELTHQTIHPNLGHVVRKREISLKFRPAALLAMRTRWV